MNIFQKIGKEIEKRKKATQKFQDKYWKLSASERMDYDNKMQIIGKNSFHPLGIIKIYFKGIFWIAGFFLVFYLFSLEQSLINSGLKVLSAYLFAFPFVLIMGFIAYYFSEEWKTKVKKEIKKRFKLI